MQATTNATSTTSPEFADEVVALRLSREGARSGELQFSLVWNDIADLDLHCVTPGGEKIYFGHKSSQCGGWLDVDMNVRPPFSLEPVENIFWHSSPSGHYRVSVNNFNNHTDPNTPFTDSQRRVPFRCIMNSEKGSQSFEGSVGRGETVVCFDFDHNGSGAVGSFVVLPPSDKPTTFSEACQKHGVTYNVGSGYYAVARKEKIQEYKEMLLQNIEKDTFEIGLVACRAALGWPATGELNMGPKDIKEGYRLFVQSTSHNRKIPAGTHVLVKVPIKEALERRVATSSQFSSETHTVGRANAAAPTTSDASAPSAPSAPSAASAVSAPSALSAPAAPAASSGRGRKRAAPAAPAPASAASSGRGRKRAAPAPDAAPAPAPAAATAPATTGRGRKRAAPAPDAAPAPAPAPAATTGRGRKRAAPATAPAPSSDAPAAAPAKAGRAKRARTQ